jgi:hypothetical protein
MLGPAPSAEILALLEALSDPGQDGAERAAVEAGNAWRGSPGAIWDAVLVLARPDLARYAPAMQAFLASRPASAIAGAPHPRELFALGAAVLARHLAAAAPALIADAAVCYRAFLHFVPAHDSCEWLLAAARALIRPGAGEAAVRGIRITRHCLARLADFRIAPRGHYAAYVGCVARLLERAPLAEVFRCDAGVTLLEHAFPDEFRATGAFLFARALAVLAAPACDGDAPVLAAAVGFLQRLSDREPFRAELAGPTADAVLPVFLRFFHVPQLAVACVCAFRALQWVPGPGAVVPLAERLLAAAALSQADIELLGSSPAEYWWAAFEPPDWQSARTQAFCFFREILDAHPGTVVPWFFALLEHLDGRAPRELEAWLWFASAIADRAPAELTRLALDCAEPGAVALTRAFLIGTLAQRVECPEFLDCALALLAADAAADEDSPSVCASLAARIINGALHTGAAAAVPGEAVVRLAELAPRCLVVDVYHAMRVFFRGHPDAVPPGAMAMLARQVLEEVDFLPEHERVRDQPLDGVHGAQFLGALECFTALAAIPAVEVGIELAAAVIEGLGEFRLEAYIGKYAELVAVVMAREREMGDIDALPWLFEFLAGAWADVAEPWNGVVALPLLRFFHGCWRHPDGGVKSRIVAVAASLADEDRVWNAVDGILTVTLCCRAAFALGALGDEEAHLRVIAGMFERDDTYVGMLLRWEIFAALIAGGAAPTQEELEIVRMGVERLVVTNYHRALAVCAIRRLGQELEEGLLRGILAQADAIEAAGAEPRCRIFDALSAPFEGPDIAGFVGILWNTSAG